jgi:hypothetical protein
MTRAIRWLPAVTALAYVAAVATLGSELVRSLGWDTDVAGPLVLAERLRGSGPVYIPHFGAWTTLWYLLATRSLPGHVQLWGVSGYLVAVGAAALLGWSAARVAGTWAGVTAAATALLVGPFALRSLLTVIYHVSNPFAAAVIGAYVVVLARNRSRLLAAGVGVLAGVNAASDPLLWIAGVGPFMVAAGLLARSTRRADIAVRAATTIAVAVVIAAVTNVVMHQLGFHVVGLSLHLAPPHDLPANIRHLGRMVALLGGANYALPGGYPREPLRLLLAVLFALAVASSIVAAVKLVAARAEPTLRAYACFWGASTVFLCTVFVVTPNASALGAKSVNYLLPLALAAGAGVALLGAGSNRGQLALATGVVVIGALNIASITENRAIVLAPTALPGYEQALTQLLETKGVTRGYAGYWDAQNLTWQSGMRLLVAPVARCGATTLCPFNFFTIRSWYAPRDGPTFLLLDATNRFVAGAPPFVREATSSYHFGPLTLYLFHHDVAPHVRAGVG